MLIDHVLKEQISSLQKLMSVGNIPQLHGPKNARHQRGNIPRLHDPQNPKQQEEQDKNSTRHQVCHIAISKATRLA